MAVRVDREDYAAQEERIAEARKMLSAALAGLAAESKIAARVANNPRANPMLSPIYAHVDRVRRAEEALDLALLDLRTARGEDA